MLGLYRFVLTVWDIMQSSGQMKEHWTGQKLASRNLPCQCWKVISSGTEGMIYIGKTQFISNSITAVN
jgi:hypothetical protein